MTEIIDIHSHVLPETDDGASSLREAVHMLKQAKQQGVQELIATPHYSGRFQNRCPEKICSLCRKLEVYAERHAGLRIKIHPGQEIFYSENVPELLARGELLTLAGSRYVLLEFHPSAPYSMIFRAVREMQIDRYIPVLAHVERYRAMKDMERVEELIDQGAYVQMNFRSAAGSWFEERTRWCRRLLKEEMVHFLATDMHDLKNRRPQTKETLQWMEKRLPGRYIEQIVKENPQRLIKDERI